MLVDDVSYHHSISSVTLNYCEQELISTQLEIWRTDGHFASCQWYLNDELIEYAATSSFFAGSAGVYSVHYTYWCGGPAGFYLIEGDATFNLILYEVPVPEIFLSGNELTTELTGYSFQWFNGADSIVGAIYNMYKPTEDGTYKLRVRNFYGCENYSLPYELKLVDLWDNLNENFYAGMVYPNPTLGILQLEYSLEGSHAAALAIYNLSGEKVSEYTLEPGLNVTFTMHEESLQSGGYLFRLMLDGREFSVGKVVVVR